MAHVTYSMDWNRFAVVAASFSSQNEASVLASAAEAKSVNAPMLKKLRRNAGRSAMSPASATQGRWLNRQRRAKPVAAIRNRQQDQLILRTNPLPTPRSRRRSLLGRERSLELIRGAINTRIAGIPCARLVCGPPRKN